MQEETVIKVGGKSPRSSTKYLNVYRSGVMYIHDSAKEAAAVASQATRAASGYQVPVLIAHPITVTWEE